jgi:hypothetical protein
LIAAPLALGGDTEGESVGSIAWGGPPGKGNQAEPRHLDSVDGQSHGASVELGASSAAVICLRFDTIKE